MNAIYFADYVPTLWLILAVPIRIGIGGFHRCHGAQPDHRNQSAQAVVGAVVANTFERYQLVKKLWELK